MPLISVLLRLFAGRLLLYAYQRTAYLRLLAAAAAGVALLGLLSLKLVEQWTDRGYEGAGSMILGAAFITPNLIQLVRGRPGFLSLTVLAGVALAAGVAKAFGVDVPWTAAVLVALGLLILVPYVRPRRPPPVIRGPRRGFGGRW